MPVRVSILVENTAPWVGLKGEYGFSAFVETGGRRYLFDTGSDDALFSNARKLGLDLRDIEAIILSHGHFDHTGALLKYLENYGSVKIYAHPGAFAQRPRITAQGIEEIGCPFSQDQLAAAGARFVLVDEFRQIGPDVYISGPIPRLTEYEDVGGKGSFKIVKNGVMVDDLIDDDLALIVKQAGGLLIISGCAHAGIINTIQHARRVTGVDRILAYIGGTHLMDAGKERLRKTAEALKAMDMEKLIVAHCTGFYAASFLHQELTERLIKAETGMIYNF